jgi:MFS family permease
LFQFRSLEERETMSNNKISPLVPRNQKVFVACLIMLSAIDSVVSIHSQHTKYIWLIIQQLVGYDSSLMGSFNVMPSYISYFTLTTTTKSLNTAVSYAGGAAISFISGPWTDWRGRREAIFWSAVITLIGGVIQGSSQNIAMFLAGRALRRPAHQRFSQRLFRCNTEGSPWASIMHAGVWERFLLVACATVHKL